MKIIQTNGEYGLEQLRLRQEKAAAYAFGDVLDIGYAQNPNTLLKGVRGVRSVTGFDLVKPEDSVNKIDSMIAPTYYDRMIIGDAKNLSRHFRRGEFDIILAMEFVEHIDFIGKFLKDCRSLLRDNGLLIITTPNPYHIIHLLSNVFFIKGKAKGCKEHINFHVPRILNMVAEESGFETVTVEGSAGRYWPLFTYGMLYAYRKRGKHE